MFASETWTRAKPFLLGFSSYNWLPNVFKNITFCVGTWTKGDGHSFTFCQLQSPQNIYEVSNLNVQFFSFWALNEGVKISILPHYEVINIFTTENMHLSTSLFIHIFLDDHWSIPKGGFIPQNFLKGGCFKFSFLRGGCF